MTQARALRELIRVDATDATDATNTIGVTDATETILLEPNHRITVSGSLPISLRVLALCIDFDLSLTCLRQRSSMSFTCLQGSTKKQKGGEKMDDPLAGTTSVGSQYLSTVTIHGRDFQEFSVDNSINFVPVDEEEADRLQSQHRVLDIVFDGRLIFPPIKSVKSVLDCGYGAAAWAVEVAEQHPDCTVIGVDISPHMKPDNAPENFWPQLDDMNKRFTFKPNTFDLVHSRMVVGGINSARWPTYLRDITKALKPGGWLQMVECYYMCQSDNGSITDEHALRQWSQYYMRSLNGIKDLRAPLRLQALFTTAGLVSVETRMIPLPLCAWSNDPRERQIGEANRDNVHHLLSNLAVYPFTERLGMSIDDVNALVDRARREAANPQLKPYFPLYVCIGRKPGG
ncbi:MAG: S-adenosyl-L-methionine-dependent methyltransferase [Lasallia pustulata]|uniref:S-adenosyl-L-methionine-dependent methyltransferase n=1 Tax=Lasallia pustulata TaxID=136370 RepID=A0A5M8PXP5_9LECA|nr:MAG: S-adenosyl-L-methionine-dependent methyltransferase [Lasallia pustulata]